jgi:hypothetical protein
MTSSLRFFLIIGCLIKSFCLGWGGLKKPVSSVNFSSGASVGRREILAGITVIGLTPTVSKAAAPIDAGEAIRRSAANIPGYGQSDVFFQEALSGSWKMTREVEFGGREPLRLTYPFRFIRSIEDDAVVADRGVNQAELEKALVRAVTGKEEAATVRSYEWAQTNPNDLRLVMLDGSKKEIKVTKRATERTDTTVSSSEFQRVTQEDERGIPIVSARRVLTKWKIVEESTVEGLEIVYSMAGGDPLAAGPGGSFTPTVLSKSRLYLVR